jgi:O-antigen/teichoic acid export membrane protein
VVTVLLTSYVFANYLSPEIYGEYKYLISLGAILTTFSLTGAAIAISQGAAKNVSGFFPHTAKLSLKYGLIVSGLAAIGSLYYYLNDNLSLALGLLIIALLQPFFNNSSLIFAYLQGSQRFKLSTKAHIFKTLTVAAIVIGATLLVQSALCTFLAFLLASIATGYSITFFYRPKREELEETEGRKLISYAKHTSVRNILSSIAGQLDKILIFQNLGAAELATYAFAVAIPEQLKGITKTIEKLLLPRYTKHNLHNIKSNIHTKSVIYGIFMMLIISCYIFIAPIIYKTLFPAYTESVFLSQIYSLSMFFALASIPATTLKSKTKEKELYRLQISTAIIQVTSLLFFISLYGLLGVVVSKFITRAWYTSFGYILVFQLK